MESQDDDVVFLGENEVGPSVRDEEEDAYIDSDYNPDDDVSDHDRDDMVYSGDDVDLHRLFEEDEEGPEFPMFNTNEIYDPPFSIGLQFSAKAEFRKAVNSHAIKIRRTLKTTRNDNMRVYRFKSDPRRNVLGFREDVINEINCDVSKDQAYRAKRKALKMIEGDPDVQYTKLWDYCEEHPGSTVILGTEEQGGVVRFSRLYMCFKALKQSFLTGCRSIIGVDGCHLKGPHGGILLTAVGIDPNNNFFPISYVVVSKENTETWKWFRGLAFSNALWRVAYATTVGEYKVRMQQLMDLDPAAIEWFKDKSPLQWSKSHFSEYSKCDMLLNNVYLSAMSCTCRKWGLSGIPCAHALSVIFYQKQDPEDYVHSYYFVATYKRGDLQVQEEGGAEEPVRKRKKRSMGQTQKLRRQQTTVQCGKCGVEGHNAGTCDLDDEEGEEKENARNNQPRTSNDRGGDNEVHVDSGINDNEVVPPVVETPTQEQDGGCTNDIGEVSRRIKMRVEEKEKGLQLPPRSIKPPSNLQSAIGIPAKQPVAQDASQQPVMLPPLSTTEKTETEDQVETIFETQVRTEVGVYPPPLPTMRASRVQIRAPPPMVGCEFFPTRINSTQASFSSSVPVVVDQGQKYVAISDLGPEMSQPSQSSQNQPTQSSHTTQSSMTTNKQKRKG
ncbi:hypothetical protein BUALT_BualtUnG0021500 [Buddleja alternifolia]|uniref:SWIM-type domain-containing protein n=1 Tax=Buddleja alternifolia TaxID=168488 RepID=A0AAV6VZ51_9LAMI|nr:hypothetical protein BUALT_BualtUnG0021500 [Buddleja alternifolia]